MRPVIGVADCRARPFRASRPCAPPEERGQLLLFVRIDQCAVGNRILLAAGGEDIGVVCGKLTERSHAIGRKYYSILCGIESVGALFANQASLEHGLLVHAQPAEVRSALARRPGVEKDFGFTVQPIGAPVWRDVCAVTPDSADLLPANRLPYVLAVGYRRAGEKNLTIRGVDVGEEVPD